MSTDLDDVVRILSDYEIGRELGRGQFGVVLAGRHRQLGRDVAIKQLAGPVAANPEYSARFRREARLLAQLDHRHVVTVYDYREEGDLRLLVMEMLTGGSFADRRSGGMRTETAIGAVMAAASGLYHVHEQGILHRDVKPENLMFDGRGLLKVTDFGLARGDTTNATALNLTQAGDFFGTPAYVAPEQAAEMFGGGWPAVGPAADQYGLAAVLYEALSGALTHDATGGVVGLCARRMNEEARPLREMAPNVPVAIERVVMRGVARDPAQRYPTVEAFAVDLGEACTSELGREWMSRSDVQIREAGPIREAAESSRSTAPASGEASATSIVTPTITPPTAKAPTWRRWIMIPVAILGLALLATVFMIASGGNEPATDQQAAVAPAELPLQISDAWTMPTDGNVFASAAVDGNTIVIGSEDGSVYGIDATTGDELWTFATQPTPDGETQPVRSSAAIANGVAYVGGFDGFLYAIDIATGAERWNADIGYQIFSSPAVSGGTVVVGADKLYAFDAATGVERWPGTGGVTDDVIVSSPAIAGDLVVVGSDDGVVSAFGLADGARRWTFATGGPVQSSPRIVDGVAYVGSNDGSLYAIDTATGLQKWNADLGGPVKSSPAVSDGTVFVGTGAGTVVALNAESGEPPLWEFDAQEMVDSSPLVVGNLVVVGTNGRRVYFLDAATGEPKGAFQAGGDVLSSPRLAGDKVIVGSHDDLVHALTGFASP
jgi:serine/threonine-protein kinase